LLANIALHGMEEALGVRRNATGDHIGNRAMVRYAEDFVVFCTTREEAEVGIGILKAWLAKRGLELSEEKTQIVHLSKGFNFLGVSVRLYETRNTKSGSKVLIKPSDDAGKKLRSRLRTEWRRCVGLGVAATIARIRPIIIGWANYYRSGVSSKTFQRLDSWMWTRIIQWMKRAHPNKRWGWRYKRYIGQFHPSRKDRWVFGDKQTGHYLPKFAWTRIERHVKVKGTSSPDDVRLKLYWWKRGIKILDLPSPMLKLAKAQGDRCPVCGESLTNGEEIHRHHVVPRSKGGTDEASNIQLVHLYCHQQAHSSKGVPTPRAAKQLVRDA
jgi:RNA-directed DNA polymerase